jgi:hypothetical protein
MNAFKILITLLALGLGAIRVWIPELTIDHVTVALIIVALLPWGGSVFKAIELPWLGRVEYPEIQKIKQRAEEAGLVQPHTYTNDDSVPTYSFENIASEDNNLALAGLRIEIESKLQKLASLHDISHIPRHKSSVRRLAESLRRAEVLTSSEVNVLMDLLPLLNKAVHGAKVDPDACQVALEMGKDILSALDKRGGEIGGSYKVTPKNK